MEREDRLAAIRKELKELLVERLSLENVTADQIEDDAPLFGEGLGLDSLDAVEIIVLLQRHYKLDVKEIKKGDKLFGSVSLMAEHIFENSPQAS
jgi:Phosphopantetheine attachment site.